MNETELYPDSFTESIYRSARTMDGSGKGTSSANQSTVILKLCNDMAKTIREQVILVIEQLVDAEAKI
jgi:hypothetical protein